MSDSKGWTLVRQGGVLNMDPNTPAWTMLSPKMQTLLKNYERLANPEEQHCGGKFDQPIAAYQKYATFLDACGHDASELTDEIKRVREAVADLQEASKAAAELFQLTPFPGSLGAFFAESSDAGPVDVRAFFPTPAGKLDGFDYGDAVLSKDGLSD
jgi:hypothetical protein